MSRRCLLSVTSIYLILFEGIFIYIIIQLLLITQWTTYNFGKMYRCQAYSQVQLDYQAKPKYNTKTLTCSKILILLVHKIAFFADLSLFKEVITIGQFDLLQFCQAQTFIAKIIYMLRNM